MVKRGSSSFSASSVAKGSIVLSKAIEKQFALEAEISQLRHHVSVLSKRLHSVTLEKQVLKDIVDSTMSGEKQPLEEEEVAEEKAAPSVAGKELVEATVVVAGEEMEDATVVVAGEEEANRMIVASHHVVEEPEPCMAEPTSEEVPEMAEDCNQFAMDLVEDVEPDPPRTLISPERRRELEEMSARLTKEALRRKELEEGRPGMAEESNRFAMDLVEEVEPDPPLPLIPQKFPEEGLREREMGELLTRAREVMRKKRELEEEICCPGLGAHNAGSEIVKGKGEGLGSSGDEDTVIGGVIEAGGASTKRKNAARRRKRKLLRLEREEEEMKSHW